MLLLFISVPQGAIFCDLVIFYIGLFPMAKHSYITQQFLSFDFSGKVVFTT